MHILSTTTFLPTIPHPVYPSIIISLFISFIDPIFSHLLSSPIPQDNSGYSTYRAKSKAKAMNGNPLILTLILLRIQSQSKKRKENKKK